MKKFLLLFMLIILLPTSICAENVPAVNYTATVDGLEFKVGFPDSGEAYAGIYNKNGTLLSMNKASIANGTSDIKLNVGSDFDYAKIFVWADQLKPLTQPTRIDFDKKEFKTRDIKGFDSEQGIITLYDNENSEYQVKINPTKVFINGGETSIDSACGVAAGLPISAENYNDVLEYYLNSSDIFNVKLMAQKTNSAKEDVGSELVYDTIYISKNILDGKKIIFIGDSFIYYGQVVLDGSSSRYNDKGYFYQLCKTNGANVSVTNWTYGGKGISYIYENYMSNLTNRYYDYVVFSGGRNSTSKAETYFTTLQNYKDMFTAANPNVKFFYLVSSGAHNISVNESFPIEILNNLKEFEKMGITIVDWGKLVSDIIRKNVAVPGTEKTYSKNSFVVHKSDIDGYHPNQLTGYITALMTYCAITGESAVGHPYDFWNDTSLNSKFNSNNYISKYYTHGTTNYPEIFGSAADMRGLQQLIDQYYADKAYRNYQFSAE